MPRDDAIIFSDLIGARRWAGHSYPKRILSLLHPLCRPRGETVVFGRHLKFSSPLQRVLGPLRQLLRLLRAQTPVSRIG